MFKKISDFLIDLFCPGTEKSILKLLAQNEKKLIFWLERGKIDPNICFFNKETLLTHALKNKRFSLLESLIDAGANPNKKNDLNEYPLEIAIKTKYPEGAGRLVLVGALIQPLKEDVFYKGFENLFSSTIHEIIENEPAVLDKKDEQGKTLLMRAVLSNRKVIVEELLLWQDKKKLDEVDNQSKTALMHAVLSKNIEMAKKLICFEVGLDLQDKEGKTALHYASLLGLDSVVYYLILGGADIHLKDKEGKTAFHYACMKKNYGCVKHLADAGAFLSSGYYDERLLIETAILEGQVLLAEAIIKHLPDLNLTDLEANSLLHQATFRQNKEIVRLLLENGARIDILDAVGETALMKAVRLKDKELCEIFLEKGADVLIKNDNLEDAYSLSMKNENKEIARLIQAHLKEKLIRDRKPFSFKKLQESTYQKE